MTSTPGVTVFIPVYNEEALLKANIRRLADHLEGLGIAWEIILGSNGSTDRTVDLARELAAEVPGVRWFHRPDKGVGAAFGRGVRMARYAHIVTVDMDLSIDLEFIARAHRLLGCNDVVVGSKRCGSQRRRWLRRVASALFIHLARRLLRLGFSDYSIAAKGYRRPVVARYSDRIDAHTFYVVELLHCAFRDGLRLTEIPVRCCDLRESRFNLIREGVYKFGHLFALWLNTRRKGGHGLGR